MNEPKWRIGKRITLSAKPQAERNPSDQFKEFTPNGWPLCPACGEDELYSVIMINYMGDGPPPTPEQCMADEMGCYNCSWRNNKILELRYEK